MTTIHTPLEEMHRHEARKVLLWIDDDVDGCYGLIRSLRGNGVSIWPVRSAEEGWQVLRNELVHLAIVDLKLENDQPNGIDFCLEAHEIVQPKSLPILIYTGFLELFGDKVENCRADIIVEKSDSDKEKLSNAVWELIGGRPWYFLRAAATRFLREMQKRTPLEPSETLIKANVFARRVVNYIVTEKGRPNVDAHNIASAAQLAADVLERLANMIGRKDSTCRDSMLSLACFWRMRADLEEPLD